MELPSLPRIPTDNLYKFVATSALVVFMASYGFGVYRAVYLTHSRRAITAEARARDAMDSLAKSDYARGQLLLRSSDPAATARVKILTDSGEAIQDSLRRTRPAFLERIETQEDDDRLLTQFYWVSIAIAALALIAAGLGLGAWYWRLQRPLDAWIQAEVAAKKPTDSSVIAPEGEEE